MKNQFLKSTLGVVTLILISTACSSNSPTDDNNNNNAKLEGVWKPIKAVYTDSGGTNTTENFSECEQTGRTIFSSNGNFSQTGYYPVSGNCELEFDNTGNWQIINENILRVTLNGQVDNGIIGDYFILELTANSLKIDADTDANSTESEVYVFQKFN
ncbi:lipocalin family protein [Mariniflexile gromovii]|uniref:Lipocalin family protein n=1 Tax=Mariniflexile gromovii TaxID=362523 RepID=A0ABS4BYD7_9FLAO|nr:lipocalin family protein [Mariniflexile gromovii]MBP0905597.1 lipocalin family protein [Mariniflexile gromovii]